MNLVVMQPYFFPYIGYFSLLDVADKFVIYDDVNYIKKGWINRNTFGGPCGPQRFTLAIKRVSQNKKICDLELYDINTSKKKFFDLLRHLYSKAPCYHETVLFLESIFEYQTNNLAELLTHSLLKTAEYLDISVDIIRHSIAPIGVKLTGEDRIIEIARGFGATKYINAIGGIKLYQPDSFRRNGIELAFLRYKGTKHPQIRRRYTTNLSIVDALMFNSPVEVREMISDYELVDG